MKILFIDNSGFSVVDRKICVFSATGKFGAELQSLGHEVEYFQILTDNKSVVNPFYLRENGIKISYVKQSKFKIYTYLKGCIMLLYRVLHSDFIYISFPCNFKFIALFCKLLNKKVGFYIRGQLSIDSKFSNFLFKYSNIILGESSVLLDKIESRIHRNISQVFLPMIPFDRSWIRRDRNYDKKDNFNLLYLGRIDLQKGLSELIDAIQIVRSRIEVKFTLNIYGNGLDRLFLEKKVRELNLSDIVVFRGSVNTPEDVFTTYVNSDLYILPTYHEGFGRTLLEAMMAGTPIITTIVGGIPALMKSNYNCFEIQPRSVESIVDTLLIIMNDYRVCGVKAKNGIEFVDKYFSSLKYTHSELLHNFLTQR